MGRMGKSEEVGAKEENGKKREGRGGEQGEKRRGVWGGGRQDEKEEVKLGKAWLNFPGSITGTVPSVGKEITCRRYSEGDKRGRQEKSIH
eukprot:749679-Hanusia_phi.AAC.1